MRVTPPRPTPAGERTAAAGTQRRVLAAASATARQALAVTGILAFAPFDAAMIAAAFDQPLPATLTALGHLVRNSLLTSQDGGYVVAHRLVHTYARRRMAVEPDIYHRLTDHLAGLFATTPERAQLEGSRPHLLALLELAQTHRAWDDVARAWPARFAPGLPGPAGAVRRSGAR